MPAEEVETVGMTMRFGSFTALDNVSIRFRPGSVHALLGENGAGKSTLVKCMMGFYQPTSGGLLVDKREARIKDPVDAQRLGLGMVYQHFTLVPSLTGAENLVVSRADAPGVLNWRKEIRAIEAFVDRMPFRPPLDRPVSRMSAGEKQKLEIVKQLYLGSRFLILDEPTSVLTPGEADEVLTHVRGLCESGAISVLIITHKFREVRQFADDVSVLRRGRLAGGGLVRDLTEAQMAEMMIGETIAPERAARVPSGTETVLAMSGARAPDRSGLKQIDIAELKVRAGEVLGIAGISGNGQSELVEMLTGQRPLSGGRIEVRGRPYRATRAEMQALGVRCLPEEPMLNACAPRMSVAENLSFRAFDHTASGARRLWKSGREILNYAKEKIAAFNVKTHSPFSPIADLSGGNVQRCVLARELSGDPKLLIVANPCFGLDFASVAAIRGRLLEARNGGAAVLLISEDLDEIFELSDRIAVMSEGRIAFETAVAATDAAEIGHYMAGHQRVPAAA